MTEQPPWRMTREQAIPLVERLWDPETPEEESSKIVANLERALACPHILSYAFWDFDPELTAEKVVDRALAYKPIAL